MDASSTTPQAEPEAHWRRLITSVHNDLLGRDPDEATLAYWTNAFHNGVKFEEMYSAISECDERKAPKPEPDWTHLIIAVHSDLLNRAPDESALTYWSGALRGGVKFEEMYSAISNCDERKAASSLWVYPGHYYSPVVDPDLIKRSLRNSFDIHQPIFDININSENQLKFLDSLKDYYNNLPFEDAPVENLRYYYRNPFFGYGDAIVLSCLLQQVRPKRIIEVGSGFSSAVILDTLDFAPDLQTECLFIEPYTERLESLLQNSDRTRVEILNNFVQDVDISLFDRLHENDILFIDSTHVVKTGSDVLYHITKVLPKLRPGVIIHFHDIFYPFEYPKDWVMDDNRSWNEIYFLQAFLMNNNNYEILFFNDYMAKTHAEKIQEEMPEFMKNSGGSFWLRKVSP